MSLDSGTDKVLADLKRKRGVVKAALTRTRNFVDKFDASVDAISLLEFRQEELPRINLKFDDIQSEIELLCTDDLEEAECERDDFEKCYFAVRSRIQEVINVGKRRDTSNLDTSINTAHTHSRARLAPIDLPKFNGNIQEWEAFFDCFKVMVHQDDYYSTAQKFYYLRSTLSGQALDLIKSLPMSDINYALAIRRLQDRYDNKDLVVQSHIREILNSPRMESASAQGLLELHSHVSAHVAALEALGQPTEHWDAWLVTILIERLDKSTSQDWQLHRTSTELTKYTELMEFLSKRSIAWEGSEALAARAERIKDGSFTKLVSGRKHGSTSQTRGAFLVSSDGIEKCVYCSKTHKLYTCAEFKNLAVGDRVTFIRGARLCFNCLHTSHKSDKCKSRFSCFICKGRHNTLIHYDKQDEPSGSSSNSKNNPEEVGTESSLVQGGSKASLLVHHGHGHVFLSTAMVLVKDNRGVRRRCHAILDSGSQVNFISKDLARQLQLQSVKATMPVSGIGANMFCARTSVDVCVESRFGQSGFKLSCLTLPVIMSQRPPVRTPAEGWTIPSELQPFLADPEFSESKQIDLLIGGGAFFDILQPNRVQLDLEMLYLQDSKLGWIVTGEMRNACLLSVGESLEEDWKVILSNQDNAYGRASKANQSSAEEKQVIDHFDATASRDKEGRFVLQLPVKSNIADLGRSINLATSRFLSVERKLQQDSTLREEYTKFMKEYLEMGHMKEVCQESTIPERSCYLPHHAVFKTSSLTTKVRIVFDASAKTSSGISLNEVLMRGPKTQEDIFSILARFRKHQFVIMSDIEKMFRQVAVAEQDWDLQRILWRRDPSEVLRTYQLVTVTYGTTPASFLATQCLVTLARQSSENFPCASKAILRDFYMDDLMTGGDTQEECIRLYHEVTEILASAKLPLRKWCSNSAQVLEYIGKDVRDPLFTLELGDEEMVKSLGLCWKPVLDEFIFNVTPTPLRPKLTKRTLLSDLNKVFDPLGLVSPVLLKGKIFLQQVWEMKMDWDSALSMDIQERWKSFCEDLVRLQEVSISRKVLSEKCDDIQIHGFSDASQEAYGACLYVRSKNKDGNWHARLLCSKTRVAPLKAITIPRLELNGALLLAELAAKIAESWSLDAREFWFWTDSTIVLGWINCEGNRLKTYVANRVSQILDLSQATQWRHVRTDDNPADLASRGLSARELSNAEKWWNGPKWLSQDEGCWKNVRATQPKMEELPEQRTIKFALVGLESSKDLICKYSDWRRLVRATAWLGKFIDFLRSGTSEPSARYLTTEDMRRAEIILLKRAQQDAFYEEYTALSRGLEVRQRSKLASLNPLLQNGLILVGGRLHNSSLDEVRKHPIVLPSSHRITNLIFKDHHQIMLHCGPQSLLASVRRRFWPLRGRVTSRSVVKKCIRCVRTRPKFDAPLMAPLPRDRVLPSRPFTATGVDFAGPLIIRSGVRRLPGKKAWIAVFICFATRAIHLEAVEELSSKAFIASLRRFMARRGMCAAIYSDNGTNFVGAQKELAACLKDVNKHFAHEGVAWHFNPPSAPHFGGIWESAVKSVKHHLTRVVKDARLTLSELCTLLCQIEACVNSRPMTPLSSDPSDMEPLTPAHFLIGGAMRLHAEQDLTSQQPTGLKRWAYVQCLLQGFWARWQAEYLPQLQVRGKWVTKKKDLAVNDIVIIKEDCTPPAKWKLGRVKVLHPGKDGIVRVVTLQTSARDEVRRPVVKLCRLPTEMDDEEVETIGCQRGEDVEAKVSPPLSRTGDGR